MNSISTVIGYVQMALAIILVIIIMLQQSGTELGGALGGGGDASTTYHTKRGFEKFLFQATIVSGFLFAALAVVDILIS